MLLFMTMLSPFVNVLCEELGIRIQLLFIPTCYRLSYHAFHLYRIPMLFPPLLLQSIKERLWWLLSVSLRVVLGPPPQIRASILQRALRLPAQLLVGSGWVGSQIEHVTCSSADDLVWKIPTHGMTEGLDHVEDSAALAGTQVPCAHARVVRAEVVEGDEVTFCQVKNVDVVADGGTVLGLVVWYPISFSSSLSCLILCSYHHQIRAASPSCPRPPALAMAASCMAPPVGPHP